jgi:hypothetical protein
MTIQHKIEFVDGDFDTLTGELVCVKSPKYSTVELCFKSDMYIPFTRIVLHTENTAKEADSFMEHAYNLGKEITRR